jgi:NADH-quinone oxidoreductase subunit M
VTAGYILLVIGRVFFGTIPEKLDKIVGDIGWMDKVVVGVLAALMILIGLFPTLSKMAPMIESGVSQILALVGGA